MSRLKSGQRGFTLVELLVVIPIMAIVVAGATAGLITVLNSGDASTHMYSLRQVQQAGYWLSTDAYQAQQVGTIPGETTLGEDEGFPLVLRWDDPDTSETHVVTYTLGGVVGEPRTLVRREEINDGPPTETTVARYLVDFVYDPDSGLIVGNATECRLGDPNNGEAPLVFKVTAQVGREPAEERTYNITLRPELLSQVEF